MFHGYLWLYYVISRKKHQDEHLANMQFGIIYNLYLIKYVFIHIYFVEIIPNFGVLGIA